MQTTSATWKSLLAGQLRPAEYIPSTQQLKLYNGSTQVFSTGNNQHIVLSSGGSPIYDSDHEQIAELYSGSTRVYASGSYPDFDSETYVETRVTIDDTLYPETTAPVINRALMQNGLSVGNAVSATCSFTVRTEDAVPRSAEVKVQMRLTNGTTTSEWLPAGTFYISRRARDPVSGLLTLGCYDALLKGNAVWEPGAGTWPRSMASVAAELAGLLGVSMDGRTAIPTSALYIIQEPSAGTTIHDVLGTIAQACGGNWIITPANELRLVPVLSAANAPSAASDVVDVFGIVSSLGMSATGSVTGVRDTWEDEVYLTGTEDGIVLDVSLPPALATEMADGVIGASYQSYALSGAIYDPAAELGDYVRAGADGEIASVLCSEVATLGIAFRGDIGAPESGEMADEYPYIGATAKALSLAKAYVREAVGALDTALDQQDIFNRLTDNGQLQGLYMLNGELYVNASYIQSGLLSADRISGGVLTLGGANNVNGQMQVLDANGNVVGTWDNASIEIKSTNGNYKASVTNGHFALFGYLIPEWSSAQQWLPLVEFSGSSADGTLGNASGVISGNAPIVIRGIQKSVMMEYFDHTIYPNVSVRLGVEKGSGEGQYTVSHPELFRKALGIGMNTGAFPIQIEQGGTGAISAPGARANLGAVALDDVILATGQYAPGNIAAGGRGSTTITFPSVGTSNYTVLCVPLLGEISCGVQNRSATSFDLWYKNVDEASVRVGTVNWAIIKLP